MSEEQAAGMLDVSVLALTAMCEQEDGPPFIRLGKLVLFVAEDLIEWNHPTRFASSTLRGQLSPFGSIRALSGLHAPQEIRRFSDTA